VSETSLFSRATRHAARSTQHVFVSPHFDDVALSCGGAVAASVAAGADTRIVTVFGGAPAPDAPLAPFARQLLREWGTPTFADALRVRRAEDEAAARALGAPLTTLPLVDGAFRHTGYPDWPAMLVAPAPQDAELPAQIALALRGTGLVTAETVLVGPLGVGRHVDHRLVLAALRQLAGEVAAVWLYEDFPYAIGYPYTAHGDLPDAVRLALADAGLTDATPTTVNIAAHIETRIRAVACYRSQIPVLFPETPMPDAVRDYAASVAGGAGAAERFWPLRG